MEKGSVRRRTTEGNEKWTQMVQGNIFPKYVARQSIRKLKRGMGAKEW